MRARSGAMATP